MASWARPCFSCRHASRPTRTGSPDSLPSCHRATGMPFEFRDPSWWQDEVYALLEGRGAAFVCFDLAGLRSPRLTTGPLAYVRLHGFERRYRGGYPAAALADWAGWLGGERAAGREVLAYLDNTMDADDAFEMRVQSRFC